MPKLSSCIYVMHITLCYICTHSLQTYSLNYSFPLRPVYCTAYTKYNLPGIRALGNADVAPQLHGGSPIHPMLLHASASIPAKFNIYDRLSACVTVGWRGGKRHQNTL